MQQPMSVAYERGIQGVLEFVLKTDAKCLKKPKIITGPLHEEEEQTGTREGGAP